MCYIMITKQIGDGNKGIENQIRSILKEKMERNSDGFYFQNGSDVLRTLDKTEAKKTTEISIINNLFAHFRLASVGEVSLNNVHGWKIGDWVFFHNGGISTYNTWNKKTKQKNSDSYEFFQDLWLALENTKNNFKDKVVMHVLETLLKKINFWGRAALYNAALDKMYLFGDFELYTFGFSYLIISSSTLDLKTNAAKDIRGFKFEFPAITNIGHTSTDGIGVIHHFSTEKFHYKQLMEKMPTKVWNSTSIEDKEESSYTPSSYTFNNNWEKVNGVWKRKNTLMLPNPDIELNDEKTQILENINNALQDAAEYDKPYTEKSLDLLLNRKDFSGWDEKGRELFWDEYGYHFGDSTCCISNPQTCRAFDNIDGIVFKEEVMERV